MNHNCLTLATATALCLAVAAHSASADAVVTFESGGEGWGGPQGFGGSTVIDAVGGNPGANMHTVFNDFGISFVNDSNDAFVRDLTQLGSVTISVDVKVNLIDFFGTPATRPWVLEFRDYDNPNGYASVFYEFEWFGTNPVWKNYEVMIANPNSPNLPDGWRGSGAEDQDFKPILPPGVTFADVLSGYDEIAFTTLEPGWFFGFTDFDVQIDNIAITTTPIPAPGAISMLTIALLVHRDRRRSG